VEDVGEVMEIGKRIAVGSGGEVEAAIIAAGVPGAIRFGDKVKRRGPGAVGAADNSSCLQLVKFCLGLLETDRVQAAGFCKNRRTSGGNVVKNAVVRSLRLEVGVEDSGERRDERLEGRGNVGEGSKKRRGERGRGRGRGIWKGVKSGGE
jgi:hypothetical protein